MYSTTHGIIAITAPASRYPKFTWPTLPYSMFSRARGSVYRLLEVMNVSAPTNSVQENRNAYSTVVAMPGMTSGRSTDTSVLIGVAPSTDAASDISHGICRKVFRITNTPNGRLNVV